MQGSKRWYALYVRPRWEKKVADSLTKKQVECYCPVTRVARQWSDRKKIIEEPLFTSYVFVNIYYMELLKALGTNGVINFVYWLDKPAVIQNEEIHTIRRFLNDYDNIVLEKVPVKQNDHVRITNGLLMEQEGVIASVNNNSTKIKVLLPSLGFMMHAEVPAGHVEIINKNAIQYFENVELKRRLDLRNS